MRLRGLVVRFVPMFAAGLLFAASLPSSFVFAQAGDGQFCVRAYEDRNANGQRDGEPFLNGGLSANLLDSNDIIIASAILDDSPTANQGIICFEGLTPAQYTVIVASADYAATTPDTLTANVQSGDIPAVLEFGAQRVNTSVTVVDAAALDELTREQALERVLMAVLGGLVAALVMLVLGLLVFLIAFRGRRRAAVADQDDTYYRRPPTSENPQVRETTEHRR